MKKFSVSIIVLLLSVVSLGNTWRDESTGYTWYYNVSDGKAEIRNGYSCAVSPNPSGALTIPSKINGYPVVSIGRDAFEYCSGLTSVTIPSSVTSIGVYAFYGCSGLTSVVLPSSVQSIGDWAFYGCDSLASVTIPACVKRLSDAFPYPVCSKIQEVVICEGVTNICEDAFENCHELVSVKIPSSVMSIGAFAFYGCDGLMSINVPSGVEYIGDRAFHGCCGLADADGFVIFNGVVHDYFGSATTVIMPSGVTSIGNCAFEGCDVLMSVTIPGSVANIGFEAFYGCHSLESVTICDGVEEIGYGAFEYCSKLRSVAIPSSVKSIGDDAFYNCHSLESVTISDGVEDIGCGAFEFCTMLRSVTIPSSVTNIGEFVFHGCDGLMAFVVADDNVSYSSLDGVLYNGAKTELIQYPASKQGAVVLPASVASIGQYAFYGCDNVTAVEIPQSVTNIGEYAFYGCRELTSVTIPPSVTSIEDCAFEGCIKLQGVYITDLAAWWKIQFAGYSANPLYYAKKLYCNGAEVSETIVPDGVMSVGNYVFYGCETLLSVTISEGVTNIGDCAFCGCCAISAITIPQGVVSIGSGAFSGCAGAMSVAIPSSVKVIANESFYGCAELDSVVIPEGVERIEYSAFSGCSKLATVTIPQSMTSSGYDAFEGCTSIRQVTAASLADWMSIDFANIQANPCWGGADLRFNNSYLSSNLILPEGLTRIDGATFAGCENLTSVSIPSSVTYIASSAFSGCRSLSTIRVDPSNQHYASIDGVLYDKAMSYLYVCPNGYQGTLTIPASVTSVPYDGFGACTRMTSIGVAEGNDRFCSKNGLLCSRDGRTVMACPGGMSDLVLPDNISDIYYGAFSKCTNLRRVTVPASMTMIPSGAFRDCCSIKELIIQGGVSKISDSAFSGCVGLTAVAIPKSVQSIGRSVFAGCEGLKEISVPFIGSQRGSNERFYSLFGSNSSDVPMTLSSVTITDDSSVPNYAFEGCKYIQVVTLPIGVSSIGDYAFKWCESLRTISLPAGIAKIGSSAFYGCSSLSEVVIPVGVSCIEPSTFEGCSSLAQVTLPTGLTKIGEGAFRGCVRLRTINIPVSVVEIGYGAFRDCGALGSGLVVVDNCVLAMNGGDSWSGNLVDIVLPSGIRVYADRVFQDCEALRSVTLPADTTTVPAWAFEGCVNLSKITLNSGLKRIEQGAFSGCVALGNIDLPEGIVAIEAQVFEGCVSMTAMHLPSTVSEFGGLPSISWGGDVFWGPVLAAEESQFTTVTVASGNKTYAVYNGCLYSKDGKTLIACPQGLRSVTIRPGTRTIALDAFNWCSLLTEITIPEGVVADFVTYEDFFGVYQDWDAPSFTGCTALRSISFPSTLQKINIPDSPVLTTLKVSAGNPEYASYGNLLYTKDGKILLGCPKGLKAVAIREGTEAISSVSDGILGVTTAFTGCTQMEEVSFPSSLNEISIPASPVLTTLRVATGNPRFASHNNLLYSKDGKTLIGCPRGLKDPVVLAGTCTIASGAFSGCGLIESLTIPASVKRIGCRPFYGCSNLRHVYYKGDAPLPLVELFEVSHCGVSSWTIDVSSWEVIEKQGNSEAVREGWALYVGSESQESGGCGLGEIVPILLDVVSHPVRGAKDWGISGEWQGCPLSFVETFVSVDAVSPGEKVEWDTGFIGYTAGGLPTGLTYNKTTGMITGAATKPGEYAVKFTKSGAEAEEMTIVVTAIPKITVEMVGVESVGDTNGCKVTGAGEYLVGKTVTLKATMPKGTVFMGWAAAEDGGSTEVIVSKDATYSFTMGKEDVALVAKFKREQMSVACTWLSEGVFTAGVAAGAEDGILLDDYVSTESGIKSIAVAKLPSGMSYDSTKRIITGFPTKAGTYNVEITVTANSGSVEKQTIPVTVAALPAWAVGNFEGTVRCADGTHGTASFTVSAAGAISSGKIVEHGQSWAFTAKSFTADSITRGLEQDYVVLADAKCGTVTRQVELHVMGCAVEGVAENAALAAGLFGDDEVELWRNVWKDTDAKGVISGIAGKYTYFFADDTALPLDLKATAVLSGKANVRAHGNASVTFSTTVFASSNGVEAAFYVAADARKGYEEIYERFALVPESGVKEPGIAHRAPGVVAVPERYPNDEGYGTVSVSPAGGQVDAGKTVTVTAKPDSKSVFVKWRYEVGGETLYSEMSKLTLTMDGEHDIFASAIFRSKGSFKEPVVAVETSEQAKFKALELGVQFSAFVTVTDVENMKPVKWSASNLPSGLKINAETGEISGVATAVNSKPVVITATSVADSKKKTTFTLDIGAQGGKPAALPETAVGTFTGFVNDGTDNLGTFTFTSSEKGALSAKVVDAKGTVSFSGSGFAWSKDGRYGVKLQTTKGEELTLTLNSGAGWDAQQLTGGYVAANGRTLGVSAQRNAFSKAWYFTAVGDETTGWTFAFTADAKAVALTVTLKADGTTSVAGTLNGTIDAKTKKPTPFKMSASGVANVGMMREGAMAADFAPVLTVGGVKKALAIRINLWFDRKNDHGSGVGEAKFVE